MAWPDASGRHRLASSAAGHRQFSDFSAISARAFALLIDLIGSRARAGIRVARVLVVDDDRRLAELVAMALGRAGYDTDIAVDGREALARVAAHPPDVLLLDIEMPGVDGLSVLDALREPDGLSRIPAVVFTGGRTTPADEVIGFRHGAVDFVVKGTDVNVLLARIENALRRGSLRHTDRRDIAVGNLHVDVAASRVTVDGVEVDLENRQFALLCYLAERAGVVITRPELLEAVWGTTYSGFQHAVDQTVYEVRKRLGNRRWIETIPRKGYRFVRG